MNPADTPPMTCIEIAEAGGPEQLRPASRPRPEPGPGEVLIRVHAAGINRPDVMQRQGMYPPPEGASDIPGLEVAGEVVAAGPGVERVSVGAAVCALVTGGGYAEYCVAAEVCCLPVPGTLSWTRAAALPETFFTVWHNVFQRARLAGGEWFLVHGGSSGIGTTAIQIAAAFSARVLATAGTPEKCDLCQRLGAERAINHREEDFVAVIKEVTGGRGVDVILDMVGGDYVSRNLKSLAVEGRLVNIAFLHGPRAEVNLLPVLLKRLTLTGSTLRARSLEAKGEIAAELREHVWPMIEDGCIAPVIDSIYPLVRAAHAHRGMEAGDHMGKIILRVP